MEFESQWNGLKIRFKREGSVKDISLLVEVMHAGSELESSRLF